MQLLHKYKEAKTICTLIITSLGLQWLCSFSTTWAFRCCRWTVKYWDQSSKQTQLVFPKLRWKRWQVPGADNRLLQSVWHCFILFYNNKILQYSFLYKKKKKKSLLTWIKSSASSCEDEYSHGCVPNDMLLYTIHYFECVKGVCICKNWGMTESSHPEQTPYWWCSRGGIMPLGCQLL